MHCKKGMVVLIQFGYLTFLLSACIVKHSGVSLPALDSTQIKNLNLAFQNIGKCHGRILC